jgi:hypothetical protein
LSKSAFAKPGDRASEFFGWDIEGFVVRVESERSVGRIVHGG